MWVVCQIGGREHYSIPRALHQYGQLGALITDFWIAPGSPEACLPGGKRLSDRFHTDLEGVRVHAPNLRMLTHELVSRLRRRGGWEQVMARNSLFQREVLKALSSLEPCVADDDSTVTLFSYSYAALELFREAKNRGWTTVLGQIDPGTGEDAIVRRLRAEHPEWAGPGEASPPDAYWKLWKEECALADRIIVNSSWSRSLLIDAGIQTEKIEVVPLAYAADGKDLMREGGLAGVPVSRCNTGRFITDLRPLRVLWLGQVIVRKGIQDLVAAARTLVDAPVRIDVIGAHGELPPGLPSNMTFHGAVPRSEAAGWYRRADVFVLPTHSDGFALTQLEAMTHGVPVIATPCCGEAVEDGVNGWIVPAGDPKELADRLLRFVFDPGLLETFGAAAAAAVNAFSLQRVAEALLDGKGPGSASP